MAFIENFKHEEKNFRKQESAETTYSVGLIDNEPLFQINMYGSAHRQDVGKASQVIQLDKKSAIELIDLLRKTFLL